VHQETYIANVLKQFDLFCTINNGCNAMSLYVSIDHIMPQGNDEQLELVLKYLNLIKYTLMYFASYTFRGILFLSISENIDI
jgi:hypothetical protein